MFFIPLALPAVMIGGEIALDTPLPYLLTFHIDLLQEKGIGA
jgi:hypothetical protein